MQKTKKQHYVPQSYLKAWAIPGTYQVHVYDKKTDNERVNSINDIASMISIPTKFSLKSF